MGREEEDLQLRLLNGRITHEGYNKTMKILKAGKPIFKACEYKGTFAGCSPLCCFECVRESRMSENKSRQGINDGS